MNVVTFDRQAETERSKAWIGDTDAAERATIAGLATFAAQYNGQIEIIRGHAGEIIITSTCPFTLESIEEVMMHTGFEQRRIDLRRQ